MKKKIQVVMLPTNQPSILHKTGDNKLWHENINRPSNKVYMWEAQHLYFLSDEEIKEGDWVYIKSGTGNIFIDLVSKVTDKGLWVRDNYYYPYKVDFKTICKKIIATTDELTWLPERTSKRGTVKYLLPQPSQQFIEQYVTEYNKGNIIEWVDVEYVDNGEEDWIGSFRNGEPFWNEKIELLVNPNNTINISPIKDSWSRDEVVEIAKKAKSFGASECWDNWLKENL